MRLEDMREQFPKMPESMKRMIEQEVAVALATTVCAGVAYQMHNQKVGKYGLKTQIEGPQTAAESTENMADQTTEERAGKAAEYGRL